MAPPKPTNFAFSIFLVNRVSEQARGRLNYSLKVQEEISEELSRLFRQCWALGSNVEGTSIYWDATTEERERSFKDHSIVCYFLADPQATLSRRAGVVLAGTQEAAGFTFQTQKGVISEVYVEMNLPAQKLAHIAFHEMMHNKIDVGGGGADIHSAGGGGLANSPVTGFHSLTPRNAQLMSAAAFKKIKQNTAYM
jgi:hypothetical protein